MIGCKHASHPSPKGLPRTTGPIKIDGETDEPDWTQRAFRTGPFHDETGGPARPYSEARFLADDANVYVVLYAADEDIRATDAFVLGGIQFHPDGTTSDPRVKAAVDRDGSLDDPKDEDEEWVVEAAIPKDLVKWPLHIERCDVLKDGSRRCGSVDVRPPGA